MVKKGITGNSAGWVLKVHTWYICKESAAKGKSRVDPCRSGCHGFVAF